MINKNLVISSSLCLVAGFVAGRLTTPAIKTQEKRIETHSEKKEVLAVQTHSEEGKQASNATETVYRKVYYCPNGNIQSREKIVTKKRAAKHNQSITHSRMLKNAELSSSKTDITTTTYGSRWGAGIFVPAKYPIDPLTVNIMLSYHIIGPFSLAAQSDLKFKNPMLGIIINF